MHQLTPRPAGRLFSDSEAAAIVASAAGRPVSVSRGANGAALSSGSSQSRPRARNSSTRNLDRFGKCVVRRGCYVSFQGFRYIVTSVRMGLCICRQVDINRRVYAGSDSETFGTAWVSVVND